MSFNKNPHFICEPSFAFPGCAIRVILGFPGWISFLSDWLVILKLCSFAFPRTFSIRLCHENDSRLLWMILFISDWVVILHFHFYQDFFHSCCVMKVFLGCCGWVTHLSDLNGVHLETQNHNFVVVMVKSVILKWGNFQEFWFFWRTCVRSCVAGQWH